MNIKIILFLSIVAIVSKYALAGPASFNATGKTYDVTPTDTNAVINAAGNAIDPVGLLVGKFPSKEYSCTATMITTNNGNIALTAGHCVYDPATNTWPTSLDFYPGFDRVPGTAGGGKIPVAKLANMPHLIAGSPADDFGMVKLSFNGKLQDITGSFGWNLNPAPNNNPTFVFGYPKDGNMPCGKNPRDTKSFCAFVGPSVKTPAFRTIPIDVGEGASGGPWIVNGNPKAKTGTIIGVSSSYIKNIAKSAAATWTEADFNNMLNYIQNA